jgi:hypothetical protein
MFESARQKVQHHIVSFTTFLLFILQNYSHAQPDGDSIVYRQTISWRHLVTKREYIKLLRNSNPITPQ